MKKRVFYQDFLYHDMQVDKEDFPDVKLEYCNDVAEYSIVDVHKAASSSEAIVNLTRLMSIRNEEDWNQLEKNVAKLKRIIIKDNLELRNSELDEYKDFYLKTYFYRLKQCCEECYIKKPLNATTHSTAVKGYKNPSNE